MDTWHKELTNAYETSKRTLVKGYENVDLKADIKALKTGVIAFESKTTGKPLYMYYMPLGMFDWELAIFVESNVVFNNLFLYRDLLFIAGIVEVIFLLIFFL